MSHAQKSKYVTGQPTLHRFQTLSIRDELEKLAWLQNPRMANRMAGRMARRVTENKDRNHKTRRTMRWQDRILLSVGAILLALFVIRAESAVASERPWGLQLTSDSGVYTQLAVSTAIQVDVTGLIARVEVTQKFSNRGKQWAEGIYRFPLPQGAAVDRLHIKVGERILEGEIQEKETPGGSMSTPATMAVRRPWWSSSAAISSRPGWPISGRVKP